MDIRIFESGEDLAQQSAAWCCGIINKTIREKGQARIVLATGASQTHFLETLVQLPVHWDRVSCFHLNEYVGLPDDHQASTHHYMKIKVLDKVKMAKVHQLDPDHIEEYSDLLTEEDIDLTCLGIGGDGHIAFNISQVDFEDPKLVKMVELDEAYRQQQIGKGLFSSLEETPAKAVTLTIPAIMRSKVISVIALDQKKANAVCKALTGPISVDCPASVLRKHPRMVMWLDDDSSQLCRRRVRQNSARAEPSLTIPGLVDLQVTGYKGVNFSSLDLTEDSFREACDTILKSFAIMFLPTVISSSMKVYEHVLPIISKVIKSDERYASRIPGIHIDGPFISSKTGARGRHSEGNIKEPDIALFDELQKLSGGQIVLITIAAELAGAAQLTAYVTAQGVRVSLGHQMANTSNLSNLCRAGAAMLTGLGSSIPQCIDHIENPLMAGLAEDRLLASIITDGHHLPYDIIKTIIRVKGPDRVIIVSDMTSVAGMSPGEYTDPEGNTIVLEEDGRVHMKDEPYVAGSASSILDCANFVLKSGFIDLVALERMCFYNPLRLLGIDPEQVKNNVKAMLTFMDGKLELI